MSRAEFLTGAHLAKAMVVYGQQLDTHKDLLNRLNVYPVPDGDTGSNMALTVSSVVKELGEAGLDGGDPEVSVVAGVIGQASLMGARGNSGVILSQILRGLTTSLASSERAGPAEVSAALSQAAKLAKAAVHKPVDGTILTVLDAAARAVESPQSLDGVLADAFRAATEALARTPDQLPELARAGVVDAGGAGLVLLFDSLGMAVCGQSLGGLELPQGMAERLGGSMADPGDIEALSGEGDDSDLGPRYEIMFLLDCPDHLIGPFREVWSTIGESIVVVGGEGLWNCHIHADDIGAAIEAALDAGRPRRIRVSDLSEQVAEERWVQEASATTLQDPGDSDHAPPRTAVVAVASGHGWERIFRSLGVSAVAGDHGANPSVAELVGYINATQASNVVILANNANVVPSAKSAADQADADVAVIATSEILEGVAALCEYDPQADLGENVSLMTAAAERTTTAKVARSAREVDGPHGRIAQGEWIGLVGREIVSSSSDLAEAAVALLGTIIGPDHEIVTIATGSEARPGQVRAVTEWLSEAHPELSVEILGGGQPVYAMLLSLE